MRLANGRICLLVFLLLPALADAAEEFEIVSLLGMHSRFLEPDARAISMGTAVTAVAEGAAAPYWNLGVLGLPGPTGALSYSSRKKNARYHFFSVTGNWNGIGVGGHFTGMNYDSRVRTIFDPSGERSFGLSLYFGLVGAGIDVGRLIPGFPEEMEWGTGLGIGLLRNEVGSSEGEGWDMDLGTVLSWRLPVEQPGGATSLTLRTGYVLRDMWDRDLEIHGASIPLGRQDRLGLAAIVQSTRESRLGPLFEATISWDRRGLFYEWAESRNQIGAEITLGGLLSIRTGHIWEDSPYYDTTPFWGMGIGLGPENQFIPGVGVQVDYAEGQRVIVPDADQITASVWVAL